MAARGQRGGRSRGGGGRKGRGNHGAGRSRPERGAGSQGGPGDVSLAVARGRLKARKKAERARKLELLKKEKEAQEAVARQRTLAIRGWHKEERRREVESKKNAKKALGKGRAAGKDEKDSSEAECAEEGRRVKFSSTMFVTNIPDDYAGELPRPVQSPLQPLNPKEDGSSDGSNDDSDEDDDPTFDPRTGAINSLLADEDGMDLWMDSDEDSGAKGGQKKVGRRGTVRLAVADEDQGSGAVESDADGDNEVELCTSADQEAKMNTNGKGKGGQSSTGENVPSGRDSTQGGRKRRRAEKGSDSPIETSPRPKKKKRGQSSPSPNGRASSSPPGVSPSSTPQAAVPAASGTSPNGLSSSQKKGKGKEKNQTGEKLTPSTKASGRRTVALSGERSKAASNQSPVSDTLLAKPDASADDDIESLFAGKRKRAEAAPGSETAAREESEDNGDDGGELLWGKVSGSGKKRFTEDGYRILSEDDIKAENQGAQLDGECPFDCSCCV